MQRCREFLRGIAIIMVLVQPVKAQVTIDVSRITCEQFILFQVMDPEKIAYWLSGYYNGKQNNTIIDPQVFKEISERTREPKYHRYAGSGSASSNTKAINNGLP